ncbi:MAG TPA: PHB depolymerase family esterase [Allosphingosinicella sp.]|nr:PHB depolymerase family esterase [Allosphingosinicella sp.]
MRLSKTIRNLSRIRKELDGLAPPAPAIDRLRDLAAVLPNPGNLRGRCHIPEGLAAGAPLVVVLHGCTQDAALYDHGTGWSRLADRHGFALLFPEQQRANNSGLCFNWFLAGDSQRGRGEAASIKALVDAMVKRHALDPRRVFVTGLSAGGAMASVMLATYPELFAGGAIIAGIPYGCASGAAEAFDCMAGRAGADAGELSASVRRASPHQGPWPRISVWQGSADPIVVPSNAQSIIVQWAGLHGVAPAPHRIDMVDGHPRRVWLGADGEELIEHYQVAGMGHGTPLRPGTGDGESGMAGAHMLDVGLSSTDRIAAFFGIAPQPANAPKAPRRAKSSTTGPAVPTRRRGGKSAAAEPADGVRAVIEQALKAAGLLR